MSDQRPAVRLFLCGDVMTGRGIDQILRHPCAPELYERYVGSATDYVALAENAHGPIPRNTTPEYVWGAALYEMQQAAPDIGIVNLETSITRSDDYLPKGINYRMSPENAECLTAFGIDCCVLANNHVLDWGPEGLVETLATLERLGIRSVGAGGDSVQANAPAIFNCEGKGRVIVFALACTDSGIPQDWRATQASPGVAVISELTEDAVTAIAEEAAKRRRPGDIVVVSLHWGSNWGYDIPPPHRAFAHALIDRAGVSVVHGHSAHHAKAVEVYKNRLILYGCGDFLNDYEGIGGLEEFRADLALMYFADFDPGSGDLIDLDIVPMQIRRFQLNRALHADGVWLQTVLDRECRKVGTRIVLTIEGRLKLEAR